MENQPDNTIPKTPYHIRPLNLVLTLLVIGLVLAGLVWNKGLIKKSTSNETVQTVRDLPNLKTDVHTGTYGYEPDPVTTEYDKQTIGEDMQSLYMYYESEAEELPISELKAAIPALVQKLAVQYKEDPIYTGDIAISIDAYLDVYKKRAPTDATYVDAIHAKLLDTYGPCLGVPKEQCKE